MSTAIISAIVSLAFLASIVLSFIVLFGDENKKSKAIAKTVLICCRANGINYANFICGSNCSICGMVK
jgi:hypothetical protein